MLRAVIYTRHASVPQGEVPTDQTEACRERIAHEGWEFVGAYTDHAASGVSLQRPGYQQLLSDAREGLMDIVVATDLDRFSRDAAHLATFCGEMEAAGVRVVTLTGESDELHVRSSWKR